MLVFSAICPHPPIVIPTIGKKNIEQVKNTIKALKNLEEELYAAKPDVIIVISPHGEIIPDAFSINLNSKYSLNFEQFGDWQTKLEFCSSPKLCLHFKERVEDKLPLVLTSENNIDHGAAVPLYYLTSHLKNIALIPVNYSLLSYEKHFEFGQLLKKEIVKTDQRVAVIASGDMSHALTKDAPAGFSDMGKKFDDKFLDLLKTKDYNAILKLDHKLIEEAAECGLRSFLILLGIIEEYNHQVEILSYEAPFGVGYLVANFKLL